MDAEDLEKFKGKAIGGGHWTLRFWSGPVWGQLGWTLEILEWTGVITNFLQQRYESHHAQDQADHQQHAVPVIYRREVAFQKMI